MIQSKECKMCKMSFVPEHHNNKYCSEKCKKRVYVYRYVKRVHKKKKHVCKHCNKIFFASHYETKYCSEKCCSLEMWKKRDRTMSAETIKKMQLNAGGIRKGAGRGKHGWYNGYWCDSSWELAWVIYNLEHGIKFERNHKWFYYTYEGKQYKFYPDFIKDGIYVEIKGYVNNKSKEKIAQFKEEIELITDVSMYTNYVINKYGKDFIRLYE